MSDNHVIPEAAVEAGDFAARLRAYNAARDELNRIKNAQQGSLSKRAYLRRVHAAKAIHRSAHAALMEVFRPANEVSE